MKAEFFEHLKNEIFEINNNHPHLSVDNCFVVWFMRAFVTDDEMTAVHSIKGKAGDKGSDAIYFDHDNRIVFIVQCKYHQKIKNHALRQDIITLADLGRSLLMERKESFESILNKANSEVKEALLEARKLIHERDYQLVLQFVTTSKISNTNLNEAKARLDEWYDNSRFDAFDNSDLNNLMQDYIEGAAPPVPMVKMPLNSGESFKKVDARTGLTSWILTMPGKDIAKLFNKQGVRLFSRNIRGYLGNTMINRVMKTTIEKESEYFWYYNNGITIVCDEITQYENTLRIKNAQIINGQQTTRTLSLLENNMAEVLVKIFEIKRETDKDKNKFRHVISEIVSATNWQNAISISDLKSNDTEQVRIEKEFKKFNYFYQRKKMSKAERVKYGANKYGFRITKEALSQALAASELDPYLVREGINKLFEDDIYSKLFNGRKAVDYLTIFWISVVVSEIAKEDSKYRYAKWPVLHFVWSNINDELKRIRFRDTFRKIIERRKYHYRELKPLYYFVLYSYKFSYLYYSKNKRKDGRVIEPIDFFKHSNLHLQMNKFFLKRPGEYKRNLIKYKEKFIQNLDKHER